MSPEVNAKELLAAVERAKGAIQNRIEGLKAQRIQIDEELAALGETAVKAPARKRKPGRPIGSRNRTPREVTVAADPLMNVSGKSTDDDRYPSIAAHHAKGKFGDNSWTDLGSDPKEPR